MRVLFISLEARHTSLASIPTVNAIKQSYPEAQIHFLLTQEQLSVLQRVAAIDKIFVYKTDAQSIALHILREPFYDYIIDITRNKASRFFTTYLPQKYKARTSIISPGKATFFPWANSNTEYFSKENLSTTLFKDISKKIRITAPLILDWQIDVLKNELLKENDIPTSHSAGYYVLAIDCNKYFKQVQNLISSIQYPIIILGNQNVDTISQIKSMDNTKVYLGLEKFNEFEMIQIFQNSTLNIVDSYKALSDLAMLAGRPIIKIGHGAVAAIDLQQYASGKKFIHCKDLDLLTTQVKSFLPQ